jgi:hypothetical protein
MYVESRDFKVPVPGFVCIEEKLRNLLSCVTGLGAGFLSWDI